VDIRIIIEVGLAAETRIFQVSQILRIVKRKFIGSTFLPAAHTEGPNRAAAVCVQNNYFMIMFLCVGVLITK
jgi:hypothetical protein